MFSIFMLLVVIVAGMLATVLAARWFTRVLEKDSTLGPKEKIAAWDVFMKAATIYTTIIAGSFVGAKYLDQRRLELEADRREAAQKVREFNLGIYAQSKSVDEGRRILLNEVADLASTLATAESNKSPMWEISYDRLDRLYHGQLVIYEGDEVSAAMVDFRDALRKWKETGEKPNELKAEDRTNLTVPLKLEKKNSDLMRQLALILSGACRIEMKRIDEKPEASSPPKQGSGIV